MDTGIRLISCAYLRLLRNEETWYHIIILEGRVALALVSDDPSTGFSDDLLEVCRNLSTAMASPRSASAVKKATFPRESSQLSEDEDVDSLDSISSPASKSGASYSLWLPDVWGDDVRMNAFFTDFRTRELNPAAYDNKMKFWMDVIDRCITNEDLVTFTASELRDRLQRKGRRAHCLPKVLEEMHRSKRFMTVEQFLSSAQDSWISWGFDMAKKPLWWSAGLVLGVKDLDANQAKFVDVTSIKTKAADVMDRVDSGILPSSAIDLASFREVFGDLVPSAAIPLVLKHLERTKQALVTDLHDPDHAMIKFLSGVSSSAKDQRSGAISDADRGIVTLRRSLQKLEGEVATLHTKIQELDGETRALVRSGNKPAAMRVLKKKKLLEKALAQKDTVMDNVNGMLFRLENSESDQKVFDAYQVGLSALKKTQQDTSLEKIEGIVDDMQEMQEQQDEISQAISSPLKGVTDMDDDLLEEELKELLKDDITDKLIAQLEDLEVAGDISEKVSPQAARARPASVKRSGLSGQ